MAAQYRTLLPLFPTFSFWPTVATNYDNLGLIIVVCSTMAIANVPCESRIPRGRLSRREMARNIIYNKDNHNCTNETSEHRYKLDLRVGSGSYERRNDDGDVISRRVIHTNQTRG